MRALCLVLLTLFVSATIATAEDPKAEKERVRLGGDGGVRGVRGVRSGDGGDGGRTDDYYDRKFRNQEAVKRDIQALFTAVEDRHSLALLYHQAQEFWGEYGLKYEAVSVVIDLKKKPEKEPAPEPTRLPGFSKGEVGKILEEAEKIRRKRARDRAKSLWEVLKKADAETYASGIALVPNVVRDLQLIEWDCLRAGVTLHSDIGMTDEAVGRVLVRYYAYRAMNSWQYTRAQAGIRDHWYDRVRVNPRLLLKGSSKPANLEWLTGQLQEIQEWLDKARIGRATIGLTATSVAEVISRLE